MKSKCQHSQCAKFFMVNPQDVQTTVNVLTALENILLSACTMVSRLKASEAGKLIPYKKAASAQQSGCHSKHR